MFENLLYKIKSDFITFLNNIDVVARRKETQKNIETKDKNFKNEVKGPERKMRRNEPCYCGSGKKFKHCHGSL